MRTRRFSVLLILASASALVLGGCSADEPAQPPAPRDATSAPPGPSGDREGGDSTGGSGDGGDSASVSAKQLLGKQDLPPAAKVQDIQLREYVEQNIGLLERVVTKPAACAGLLKRIYQSSGSDTEGVAAAAQVGKGQIVQTLGSAEEDGIAALRALAERCPRVESTVDDKTSRVSYRKLDTTKLDADESFGVLAVSRGGGSASSARSVQILAIKGGRGIALTITGDTGSEPVSLANKALAKLG